MGEFKVMDEFAVDISNSFRNYGESRLVKINKTEEYLNAIDDIWYGHSHKRKFAIRIRKDIRSQGRLLAVTETEEDANAIAEMVKETVEELAKKQVNNTGERLRQEMLNESRDVFVTPYDDVIYAIWSYKGQTKEGKRVNLVQITETKEEANDFAENMKNIIKDDIRFFVAPYNLKVHTIDSWKKLIEYIEKSHYNYFANNMKFNKKFLCVSQSFNQHLLDLTRDDSYKICIKLYNKLKWSICTFLGFVSEYEIDQVIEKAYKKLREYVREYEKSLKS